ncbi:MAG: amino acid ABC transporter ATP-binding protein [Bacillota bacterium]|nr:amino acid ABC transporter ATP-binding protein [Bacillota bacterium]
MSILEVKNLKKSFKDVDVLDGINFSMERGETIAVIGPSGGGKSTMLRCLINLERADGGDIIIENEYLMKDGAYVSEKQAKKVCSKMGMVFQSFNLFPHLTVMNNLCYAPVLVKKENKEAARERAVEMLKKVGLSDKAEVHPGQLSGGQKQRVAIARALMMNPDMLLFDEPTSSLDPQLTGEVLGVMRELAAEKMTMIVVTHEMAFAREAANRILFMMDKVILDSGTPEEFFQNRSDPRISEFIDSIL